MAKIRKCCGTSKGGPHKKKCPNWKSPLQAGLDRDGVDKKARRQVVEDIGDDLPDGAFFALAGEFGLEPEDFID